MSIVQKPVGNREIDGVEDLKNGIWPRSVPLWMAAFYVALFIIRPWEKLIPWLGDISFERIYVILMLIAVFLSKEKRFSLSFQSVSVLFFLMGIAISAILARKPSLAWEPLYSYLTLVIFYFVLLLVIRTPYELAFMVICYITTMAIYLWKSQWEFWIYGQNRYDMGVVRLVGIENTFGDPNNLAMSIVVSLPIALFLWSFRKELSSGWPIFYRKWFPRFVIFYFFLATVSILMTNSRSGMVSFIVFIVLSGLHGKGVGRKIKYLLVGTLILSGVWLVMPEKNKSRFETIWDTEKGPHSAQVSAEGRIEGYKAGMKMFERFPLTGVGVGNFIPYRVVHVDGVPLNAHNLAGQLLGETGIVGGITFLLMVLSILLNCRALRLLGKESPSLTISLLSALGLACRNSVLLLCFTGLFGHNLFRFNWLWLAAFSSLGFQYASEALRETQIH